MAAKTPFRLFAFIQDLHWKFLERVPQSDHPGYQSHERRSAGHYKDVTETGNRARKVSGTQDTKRLQLRALLLLPEGLWIHPQNFKVELPSCQSMNNLFFELFHSKNGQLKCPNTKLLSLLVTADEDCRLIFSIWWINRADQHETEIEQILSETMSLFGRLRLAKTSSSQQRKSQSSEDGIKNASVRNPSLFPNRALKVYLWPHFRIT